MPCLLPEDRRPEVNRDAVIIYLEWREAASRCALDKEELIRWYEGL